MIYQWKSGCRVGCDAQIAGEYLERIREENNGQLTPELIVANARPNESPLHSEFEWDDEKAAGSYRMDQARSLVRKITVVYEDEPTAPKNVRAFVSVISDPESGERAYVSARDALHSPELREQVLSNAIAEAIAWKRRWNEYSELARVFSAIDELAAVK